ncbi:DUF2304 domain-containing protein [Patescibacteria group bacterium]|nr:DUF2304 domain-containing protein [Patescibacteria group bacterium]
MVFQIALGIFAVFALSRVFLQYRKKQVSLQWLLSFGVLWLAVLVVAFVPWATDIIASLVGVGRGADLLVYCAIVVLIYAVYRLLVTQQKLERDITVLTRKIAIEQAKERKE